MKFEKLLLKVLYGSPKVLKFDDKEFFLYCDDFDYAKVYTIYNNKMINLGCLKLRSALSNYFTKKEFDFYLQNKLLALYNAYEREMKVRKILIEFWEKGWQTLQKML